MKIDQNARYTKTHEWARKEDDVFVIGISDYAQSTLSDIVYVELPEVGDEIIGGDQFGVVESVKAAADVFSPLSGEVVAINEALEDAPEVVNSDAFGDGWLIKIKAGDETEWDTLLTPEDYQQVIETESE
ncbi:MAG: glycine cleavage system protein GcvH [Chloroflexi bacterium]|nr:MAG: glycine cleavage system protein GcvH [Chloroflexota bacterium]